MPKWSHYLDEEFEDEYTGGFQKIKRGQRNKQEKEDKREKSETRQDVFVKNTRN